MTKETISVQRALSELTILDKKINDFSNENHRFTTYLKSGKMVRGHQDKDRFAREAKGYLDSLVSALERRSRIKSAVVQSNALTKITVAGKEMTVAEAIEMKKSIEAQEVILYRMKQDLARTQDTAEYKRNEANSRLEARIDELTRREGRNGEVDLEDEIAALRAIHDKTQVFEVFDPANVVDFIEKHSEFIVRFRQDIDLALLESNVATEIEF